MKTLLEWIRLRIEAEKNRAAGGPPPWSDDPTMASVRFTHPYREWDLTTRTLRAMTPPDASDQDLLFNSLWLRLTARPEHMARVGWVTECNVEAVDPVLNCETPFTSNFLCCSSMPGMKRGEAIRECLRCTDLQDWILDHLAYNPTMENAVARLLKLPLVGKFTAYEIACDLRRVGPLCAASDVNSWANIGPGSGKCLRDAGLAPTIQSMRDLLVVCRLGLSAQELEIEAPPELYVLTDNPMLSFELREVEHSLCETMKFIRARQGKYARRWKPRNEALRCSWLSAARMD